MKFPLPLVLSTFILIVGLIASLFALSALSQQVESRQIAVDFQDSGQFHALVQIQRELLRMKVHVAMPIEQLDLEQAKLQFSLLTSRINYLKGQLNIITALSDEVRARQQESLDEWDNALQKDIERFLDNPTDRVGAATLLQSMDDYEVFINQSNIIVNHERSHALTAFLSLSHDLPSLFVIVVIVVAVSFTLNIFSSYFSVLQSQAAATARQANQLKDQFLAVMSHELRTPLNAIIGFLGLMKMTAKLPDKTIHMIDRSRSNAERLLSLIDDILDISKIEAGRFEIHPEVVKIKDLAVRWNGQMAVLADHKGLTFTTEINPNVPERLLIDPDALTKMVTNLLSNAFKFTEQGGVNLAFAMKSKSLEIKVTDSGIGIATDKFDVIFESFRQVDGSIRRAYGGTGLGLSIVKQLVKLLGGQVSIESVVGKGSTFTLLIPVVEAPQERPGPQLQPSEPFATESRVIS